MQVHMKLFVDKIILNVVIWITQDIPEFGGFYKNGEFCSGKCEEIKLKYIKKENNMSKTQGVLYHNGHNWSETEKVK